MSGLNEKEEIAFVSGVINIVDQNSDELIAAGFDPANRSDGLKTKLQTASSAEATQQKAQAAAMDATKMANSTRKEAYNDASAFVNVIDGLLGKDHNLVKKLRQLRK